MLSIWIIEDDLGCRFVYREIFSQSYSITFFDRFQDFANQLKLGHRPDIIIADERLPDGSFLSHYSSVLVSNPSPPLLMVSSMDERHTISAAFSLGAVDYITKPFGHEALLIKVERLIDARKENSSDVILDPVSHSLVAKGIRSETLTSKEIGILGVLLKKRQSGATRSEIIRSVWAGLNVSHKTFDVHLHNLRRKIRTTGTKIHQVASSGYILSCNGVDAPSLTNRTAQEPLIVSKD